MYRLLDLFSGIGGFSLGLERSGGFKTVAFCEIDPFCRKVLRRHWPDVPQYEDVRTLTADRLAADGISVDAICGGFPCQDISTAGAGAGLAGERSGLWREYARIIGELRPRYVIVENVSALLGRGLDVVLGDLAALGFDAEWHCIPASALGAPHRRDRVWLVAHPMSLGVESSNWQRLGCAEVNDKGRPPCGSCGQDELADAICKRQPRQGQLVQSSSQAPRINRQTVDALSGRLGHQWRSEPALGRVANGVPDRLERLRALGNAVVPQIPELIGRAILASEEAGG